MKILDTYMRSTCLDNSIPVYAKPVASCLQMYYAKPTGARPGSPIAVVSDERHSVASKPD